MAEIQQKRLREEEEEEEETLNEISSPKRQKQPYNNILSLLDEEEEIKEQEINQDLSAIFTTLQQELSSDYSTAAFEFGSQPYTVEDESNGSAAPSDLDEDVKSVMRHLLEASDDELGIPNRGDNDNDNDNYNANIVGLKSNENFPFAFMDGLWELEDEAANYYTVLQSELFM